MNKKEAVDGPFFKKRCKLPFNFGRPVEERILVVFKYKKL